MRFKLDSYVFASVFSRLGHSIDVDVCTTTIRNYTDLRRAWRRINEAWEAFESTVTLSEVMGDGLSYGFSTEAFSFTRDISEFFMNSSVAYPIPFSEVEDELQGMLPRGVRLEVSPSGRMLTVTSNATGRAALGMILRTQEISSLDAGNIPPYGLADIHRRVRLINATWRDTLREIIRQNREINPEHLNKHDRAMLAIKKKTGKSLEAFLQKRREELEHTSDQRVIATLPVAPHGTLSSRRWGIEIELAGARGIEAPGSGWEKKDDGSLRSAYGDGGSYIDPDDCPDCDHREEIQVTLESGLRAWVQNPEYEDPDYCDSCGDGEYDSWEDTAEIISPILRSFHSRGLEKLLDDAKSEPQNDTAGTHVHVEAKDLTPKQLGALVYAYEFIEPLIEASYGRWEREYCNNFEADELQELNRRIKSEDRFDYGYLAMGRRYKTVNLMAMDQHGTVEFRAMGPAGGDIDYEYLIKWAHFCREMVNCAKNNAPMQMWSSVRTFDDVKRIFAKYGEETSDITLEALDFKPDVEYDEVDVFINYTTAADGTRELIEV